MSNVHGPASASPPADPRWPLLAARFASHPAQYADPSWFPEWVVAAGGPLPQRLERELSAWLLVEHGLGDVTDWILTCEEARLFMMDATSRLRIAEALGVARHRAVLRQVVLQPRVEHLQHALGDALDALWSPLAEAVEPSPYKLALRWDPADAQGLREQLRIDGQRVMLSLFDPHDSNQRAAARRAALCLPRALVESPWPPLSASRAWLLTRAIVQHAVPAWAPEWTWLF